MPLITIVIYLIIVGVLLWLVNTFIPIAAPIKTIINVLVILVIVIWLLGMFVPLNIPVGRVR